MIELILGGVITIGAASYFYSLKFLLRKKSYKFYSSVKGELLKLIQEKNWESNIPDFEENELSWNKGFEPIIQGTILNYSIELKITKATLLSSIFVIKIKLKNPQKIEFVLAPKEKAEFKKLLDPLNINSNPKVELVSIRNLNKKDLDQGVINDEAAHIFSKNWHSSISLYSSEMNSKNPLEESILDYQYTGDLIYTDLTLKTHKDSIKDIIFSMANIAKHIESFNL